MSPGDIEVIRSRAIEVGGLPVARSLPRRARRTVGAWCLVDHLGPLPVASSRGLAVGPHPHMGLQTVTWLIDGEVMHRDSLGSEQLIRPGQLNLMTSGSGLSHAEESTANRSGAFHGVQLWIALPETTRHDSPAFTHHPQLPTLGIGASVVTVFVGEMMGVSSPARCDSPLLGVEASVRGQVEIPLRPDFEYAVVPLDGDIGVGESAVALGELAYLAPGGDDLRITAANDRRALLLGGQPFEESIVMWWNFVVRSRAEVEAAYVSWQADDGRFGVVNSALERISASPPNWLPSSS